MLPGTKELSHLLNRLYDAASGVASWEQFLQTLVHTGSGEKAGLIFHKLRPETHTVAYNWGMDAQAIQDYAAYFGSVDVWAIRSRDLRHQEWFGTSEDLLPSAQLVRSEFYNDFLRKNEAHHALFAWVDRTPESLVSIGIYRGDSIGEFDRSDTDLLQFLIPHIRRAYRLHLQVQQAHSAKSVWSDVLDHFAAGVVLLNAAGKVMQMNQSAERFLLAKNGLEYVDGRLVATHPAAAALLRRLVAECNLERTRALISGNGVMRIPRANAQPLYLIISLLGTFRAQSAPCTVIFLIDPDGRSTLPLDLLRTMFGLTNAEGRITELLAEGQSTHDIAQALSITANTLKTHLASIYRKTGTQRQTQLVKLVSQFPPAQKRGRNIA